MRCWRSCTSAVEASSRSSFVGLHWAPLVRREASGLQARHHATGSTARWPHRWVILRS
jgi:hypothetical protein